MARPLDPNKASAVLALKPGDNVLLTDGQIATFKKANRTKFLGDIDGGSYNIPMNMFVKKMDTSTINTPGASTTKIILKEHECMILNEYFYANEDGKAVLYIFEKNLGMNIVARNPITDTVKYVSVDKFVKKLGTVKK